MSRKFSFSLVIVTLVSAVLALTVACGNLAERLRPGSETPTVPAEVPEGFETVWEVYRLLSQEFVEREHLDPAELSQGAIRGMLQALDAPYTSYLTPRQYQLETQGHSGTFEGIGAEVTMEDGKLIVVAPIPNTPAERAGIRSGDVILAVNEQSLENTTLVEAVLLIRGSKGSTVSLLVQHQDAPAAVTIAVVRGVIQVSSVTWTMLPGDIAHLRISSFVETTPKEVKDSLREIEEARGRGIVLDLRNNLGGLLSVTVKVASQFLTEGLVLYEIDNVGRRTDWKVESGALAPDVPLVVLVNQFSASGSEVLVGALQDRDRAIVVGTQTFGKGSVNILRRLSDGSGLYLTFARWYTPQGRLIEGTGLTPDVVVESSGDPGQDLQLQRAVQLLLPRVGTPAAAAR